MRPAGNDDLARAISPTNARYTLPGDPARPSPKLPEEQSLLDQLWRISHFGWMPEAAILRSLSVSGQEIPAAALAERLRQLLKRGWAEQRQGEASTSEREWRVTDCGRNAR